MQPRDVRVLLLLSAVIGRSLKATGDRLRRDILADTGDDPDDAMEPGERRHVHVRGPQGERIRVGTVRVDQAPVTATVTDPDALLAWVKANAPTEVVETVRESYKALLLKQVREHGQVMHPVTGELVDLPGVEQEVGDPRVVVTPAAGAAEALGEAWRRGELPVVDGFMREIGPGGIPDG